MNKTFGGSSTRYRIVVDSMTEWIRMCENKGKTNELATYLDSNYFRGNPTPENKSGSKFDSLVIYTVYRDLFKDENIITAFRRCGGIIEMKFVDMGKELKRMMCIRKMQYTKHPLKWFEFEITSKGIVLKD